MKRLLTSTIVAAYAIIQPVNAAQMLFALECADNPALLMEQVLCPNGIFNANEARQFIHQLKSEAKAQYGIDIDLNLVIEEAIGRMQQMGQFSEFDIATARQFYSQIFKETRPLTRINNAHQSKKKKHKDKELKEQELILPNKMAGGFMCILGGSLLCILPFGITQGLGTGLICTGVATILDSSLAGERPFYIDTATGTPLSLKH
jgi:hypothetical protein